MGNAWTTRQLLGVELPVPRERLSELDMKMPGREELGFTCRGLDLEEAGRTWDAWAREKGLEVVSDLKHQYGLARLYGGGAISVTISLGIGLGESTRAFVSVARRHDLPRSPESSVSLLGLSIPLPPDVVADAHEDLRDEGGGDQYDYRAPHLTTEAMRALYLPWARENSLRLEDQMEQEGDAFLMFRREDGAGLFVCLYAGRGYRPTCLRIAGSEAGISMSGMERGS